jgi:RNA recognition motif-containing protein
MEPGAYEMSKKPRYGMNNSGLSPGMSAPKTPASANSYENYGYGGAGPAQLNNLAALYTTPGGLNAMTSPNSAPATTQAPPSPYIGSMNMGGMQYNPMMGMNMGLGVPGLAMNGGMFPMGNFGYSPQLANFPQSATSPSFSHQPGSAMSAGLISPALSNFGAQTHYNPAVAAAGMHFPLIVRCTTDSPLITAAAAANNATGRTVYIGNLPPSASVDELLNLVHFGPLESVRVLPAKSCVFLSFLDGATAAAFHADATIRKVSLHGQELKIGWGKASPVPSSVLMAISQSGASRNVYLGGLEEGMTEEHLRDDLSRFGLIDQVKIVRDKNIGFVHFLSIATATKVVATLPTEPAWAGKRVNYGKDRCAYIPKSQQAAAAAAQVAAAQSLVAQSYAVAGMTPASATFGEIGNPANPSGANLAVMAQAAATTGMNRTVYLGNIHPETTTEDLCNAVRGGVLHSIRYMPDKHICFVTFVDPAAAFGFFQATSFHGLTINGRRVKIGWGRNTGPLPASIAVAVHGGATRNVYVGNISQDEWDSFSEERLRNDFGEFGEIELVNFFKEK